jgi:hypothetical protein
MKLLLRTPMCLQIQVVLPADEQTLGLSRRTICRNTARCAQAFLSFLYRLPIDRGRHSSVVCGNKKVRYFRVVGASAK